MPHVSTERVSSCPICKSSAKQFWALAHDRLYQTTAQEFEYSKCLDCGSLYQSLRPVSPDIWKCYPNNYGPHGRSHGQQTLTKMPRWVNGIANRLADRMVGTPVFRRRISEIEENLRYTNLMLDFGCGAGKYLDRAKEFGCLTVGMDFSAQVLEQVRARGHRALPVEESSWEALGVGTVGFVRMNHVVEHLYDPEKVLGMIYLAIRPGGILHLSAPNPNGPSAIKYRSSWFSLECPRHIILIPPERAVLILQSLGYSQIEVLHEPTAKDFVRSWAYTLVDRGILSNNIVGGLAEDGLLNLWFGRQIVAAMKRGEATDRYHIIARKMAS